MKNNNLGLISVIVPAYNCENTIEKCIDSLLHQTYKNIEIIVVNDGSVDTTEEKMRRYTDERVKFISQENKGVSAARNKGISVATGKYISFVDSDDYVETMFLEELIGTILGGDLSVVGYTCSEDIRNVCEQAEQTYSLDVDGDIGKKYLIGELGKTISFSVWNKLFSKELIDKKRIKFNEDISMGEDMIFVFRYICYCKTIKISKKIMYHYIYREESAINSAKSNLALKYEKTYENLKDLYENGISISGSVLSGWSLSVMPYILLNRFVSERKYKDFKQYMKIALSLEIFKSAKMNNEKYDIKKRVIQYALRMNSVFLMYIMVKGYKLLYKNGENR